MWTDHDFDRLGEQRFEPEADWAPELPEIDEAWNAHWLEITGSTYVEHLRFGLYGKVYSDRLDDERRRYYFIQAA